MANPFDDFDESGNLIDSGNPFDEFDESGAKLSDPFTEFDDSGKDLGSRTIGGVVNDLWVSYAGGANALLKIGGDIYGLTTGDMENFASEKGARGSAYFAERKSDQLKAAEENRKKLVAQQTSTLGQAGTAFWETISSPILMTSFIFEQAPMLIPVAGIGRIAGLAANALGATERIAAIAATTGAVTAGASMSGADAGSQAYDKLLAIPDEVWKENPLLTKLMSDKNIDFEEAKKQFSLPLSQNAAIAAAIVSGATNMLPGARYLERTLAGVKLPAASRVANATIGFLGEATQEGIEEGFGAFASNVAEVQVDHDIDIMKGVGEQAGLGAAGGIFGGVAGGMTTPISPEAELAQEMAAIVDGSGFRDSPRETARKRFYPATTQEMMADTITDITSAVTVDEAIQTATDILGMDTPIPQAAATGVFQDPTDAVAPIEADLGVQPDPTSLIKQQQMDAAHAARAQGIATEREEDEAQAPVDLAIADAEGKDLIEDLKDAPASPAMAEAMNQAKIDAMQPMDMGPEDDVALEGVEPADTVSKDFIEVEALEPIDSVSAVEAAALEAATDFTTPQKFVSSQKRADKEGGQYKEIKLSDIDLEASGLDLTEADVDRIIVLEQRGLNFDGRAVGKVKVSGKDGIQTIEVKFKADTKKELEDIRIEEDVVTPEGDTVMASRTADVVMKEIDQRIDGMKLLSGCMSGKAK